MRTILAVAATLSILTGCMMGQATKPFGTETVAPGQKWSKDFVNVGGDYTGRLAWEISGGTLNVYALTESEWKKWQAGAAPDTVTFTAQKMGATGSGDMTMQGKASTTYFLVFENPGTTPAQVKWEASQASTSVK